MVPIFSDNTVHIACSLCGIAVLVFKTAKFANLLRCLVAPVSFCSGVSSQSLVLTGHPTGSEKGQAMSLVIHTLFQV